MPKLRGIDTRGRSRTECLDRIRNLLDGQDYHNLRDDFELSCECGYGQFIWQTSSFLQEYASPSAAPDAVAADTPVMSQASGAPPVTAPSSEKVPEDNRGRDGHAQ